MVKMLKLDIGPFCFSFTRKNIRYSFSLHTINNDSNKDLNLNPNSKDISSNKEESSKEDSMKEESSKEESSKEDSMKEDSMKEDSSKEESSKEESSKKIKINDVEITDADFQRLILSPITVEINRVNTDGKKEKTEPKRFLKLYNNLKIILENLLKNQHPFLIGSSVFFLIVIIFFILQLLQRILKLKMY